MDELTRSTRKRPDVPDTMQAGWQRIVDLMARALAVPAGLIMKVDPPQLEVFRSSLTESNPFRKGERADLLGLYCEKVIKQRAPLLVPDALKDPEWAHSPGARSGMTFYLGYPLAWPDGEIFGTICVLDEKDNPRATQFRDLISAFQQVAERDLCLICEAQEHEDLSAELQCRWDHSQQMVAEQTADLRKNKELIEERLRFEILLSDISANFVNVPPERVEEEIALALKQICKLFGDVDCGLLEVLTGCRQVRFLNLTLLGERRQEFLNADMASGHPWVYHRLVEEGAPVVLSSLAALPPEATVDRASLEREGVQALFILPLRFGGQVTHLIGLAKLEKAYEWPLSLIPRLRVLGEIFVRALIHMRDQEALLRSERRLAEAQRIAGVGCWEWNIISGELQCSDEVYRIFGLLPREAALTYKRILALIHPDDRRSVRQALDDALADPQSTYSMEHRLALPDGAVRVVLEHGEVIFNREHKPVRMIGAIQDITERKHDEETLRRAFEEIFKLKKQLEAENVFLRGEVESKEGPRDFIGASDPMKYVMYRIQQVARTNTTVLLTGETGTGKGIFARFLHRQSDRRDKPFVNVNCAGLPPNLIESELFGREKGAFTGSTARQIGRFELADGGTIFLDEIGELPIDLQTKLLKVIEEGEFERLGSPRPVKVDVRIIASTNRNLGEEIKKGRFRMDLYYRLNVFPVTIPPLRDRKEDIPLLVKFYTHKFSKSLGKDIRRIPKNTMKSFEEYDWPGNVRELINVVERAVIVNGGPELRLAEKIPAASMATPEEKVSENTESQETKGLVEIEKEHVLKALLKTGWRIEGHRGAAHLLQVNPSTLRARMKKFGLKRPGNP